MVGRVRAINKFLFGKEASRASISMCSLPDLFHPQRHSVIKIKKAMRKEVKYHPFTMFA
jgi:hypothetical protein